MARKKDEYKGFERRHFPRLRASVVEYAIIGDKPSRETSFTEDIGGGGICILASDELEINSRLMLKMYLPNLDDPIEATGRVVWCQRSSFMGGRNLVSYDVGVEFIEISDKCRDFIDKYVRKYSSN